MSSKTKRIVAAFVIFVFIVHLLLLYYTKYHNQSLPFSDFRLLNIGNILNFVFTLILIIGILVYSLRDKSNLKPETLIIYTVVSSFLLILCILSSFIKLSPNNIYIFEQSFNKLIVGFIFASYQFVILMFISVVWLRLLTTKNLIFIRVIVNSLIAVIVLLLFAYFFMDLKMKSYSEDLQKRKGDNIGVVLGAAVWSGNKPSPTLASRIDKAAELYKEGIINKVQLTGSNAPGELSEAEVAYNYILKKGVNSSDIMIEAKTTSTNEQIKFIKQELVPIENFDNIYIISDEYHLVRVREISSFFDLNVKVVASELRLSFDSMLYYRVRESVALLIFWCFAI